MANLILQRKQSDEIIEQFYTVAETTRLMESLQSKHPYSPFEGPSLRDGVWNAYDYLRNIKLEDLAKPTGLTVDDYIRMMTTPTSNALRLARQGGASNWFESVIERGKQLTRQTSFIRLLCIDIVSVIHLPFEVGFYFH